jgi:hypothetical protein
MTAVYEVKGNVATATRYAGGPWDPSIQHGAAIAGLVAWAAERIEIPYPMHVVRISIEFLRPTPIRPIEIRTEVERAGRKAHMASICLLSEGAELVRARVLRMRSAQFDFSMDLAKVPLDLSGPERAHEDPDIDPNANPFFSGVSMRFVEEFARRPGSAAVWVRPDRPLVLDAQTSPLMCAAIAADFTSGPSAVLDFRSWSYVNTDLSIFLTRPPVDDWILLNAETWLGDCGTAIAASRLADIRGYFGRVTQTCLIESRHT